MTRSLVARMTGSGCLPEAHFFNGEGRIFRAVDQNQKRELMWSSLAGISREVNKCFKSTAAAVLSSLV